MGITTAAESRLNGLSSKYAPVVEIRVSTSDNVTMEKVAKWAGQALWNDEKVCIRLQMRKKLLAAFICSTFVTTEFTIPILLNLSVRDWLWV